MSPPATMYTPGRQGREVYERLSLSHAEREIESMNRRYFYHTCRNAFNTAGTLAPAVHSTFATSVMLHRICHVYHSCTYRTRLVLERGGDDYLP